MMQLCGRLLEASEQSWSAAQYKHWHVQSQAQLLMYALSITTLDARSCPLQVELVLTDSEYTRKMWPHKFKAVYSVHLHGENLHTDLRIINEGDKPFTFTAALHSYFEVADIGKARVHGLKGLTYLDKVRTA